ncbi:SDR family oxidoreductase [Sporohalobacter salinus]|uniref:SDR family oxidoreductase n=1 Tax=Sporohalobacter salinus TaxID=1494606 RepID=UPI00195F3AA2|nr:SDR family oxidoreductase [Sporohalobacter salinus]MBM7622993.1 UDP-glucose 4-epimerase [Sporohalobacter salinus]
MKVLVTGGAGFIGSHIVDELIKEGADVIVVDNLSTGCLDNVNSKAKFYEIDIRDEELKGVFAEQDIDYVIHQAAQIDIQKSIQEPTFDAQNNIEGTINLLEACREYKVKKIIYASSAAVYGSPEYLGIDEEHPVKPISLYGISKHTPEHYIKTYKQLYDLDYTILRYANVYGPRQDPKGEGGVISIFVDAMLEGKKPTIFGDGQQTRDFIYVKDIAQANLAALKRADNKVLNISCHTQTSINELVTEMNQILGSNLEADYEDERPGDIRHSYLTNQKAIKQLDWQPEYDLETGLRRTLTYYQEIYQAKEEIAVDKGE